MPGSMALAKRSAEMALMPPPPTPKRIKRPPKVLDEETYTSALSHIIARDFFPGLLETESQQDYLNALDAGDEEWIEEAEKRVKEVLDTPRAGRRGVGMTPRGIGGDTPRGWVGPTPLRTPVAATPSRSISGDSTRTSAPQEKVNLNLSLEAFQAKYTSEDNESFNAVLDRQNAKKREKYGWLWNSNKIPSARQIAQAARNQKLIAQSSSSISTALTLRPSQDQDLRPASIDQRPHDPLNNFMFVPPALDDSHPHLQSSFTAAEDASRAAPKSVSYTSTRLPNSLQYEESEEDDDTASVSLSIIDAAIAGHIQHRASSTIAPSVTDDGTTTPRVNGYAFVDEEPTPAELGVTSRPRANDALLRRLITAHGGGDGETSSARNPFSIQASSKREDLHHRLVDRTLASQRRVKALKEGTPRFMSSPLVGGKTPGRRERMDKGDLTPAARGLLEKVGRTPGRLGTGGKFGEKREKGERWTPRIVEKSG